MKTILGIYNDDHQLLEGAKKLYARGIVVKNVFSPFPIHGIDQWLGVKKTRLAICSFLYGATGMSLALLMMWYMNIFDWQANIGGKPNFALYLNLPSFIPITFEVTVLCAAHLMVLTFLFRSKLFPGVTPARPDIRLTDDKFGIQIDVNEINENEINTILKETGVEEIK